MTIEEKLKLHILEKYCTMAKFGEDCNISPATLSAIFKRGLENCSASNLFKITSTLGISLDALQNNQIVEIESLDKKEIELNQLIRLMTYAHYFTINGKKLSESELKTLNDNFELTIEILKKQREQSKKDNL